jgi:uncharacterized protein YxjI
MRQKMISLGDDFTIEDESGRLAYEVDGKVMRLRDTFELKNPNGEVVATIRGKLVSIRAKMDILRHDAVAATVSKTLFAPLREKFKVELQNGEDIAIAGSILDHEYTLRRGSTEIAAISKKWFSFTDTYGIEIRDGEDEPLILSIAVALDEMSHDDQGE